MKYFTADLHFGDNEIIEREWRPFKDIEEPVYGNRSDLMSVRI